MYASKAMARLVLFSKNGEAKNDQLVRFLVVESVHPGLSPRLGTGARIFLDSLQDSTAL